MKTKWALVLTVVMTVSGTYAEDGSCKYHESRIIEVEKRLSELEAIVKTTRVIPACKGFLLNLRHARVGFKCRTSKGAIYERVERRFFGEAWKGPDGLIYSDRIDKESHEGATERCKRRGARLPSDADINRSNANGFREVLPHLADKTFWTSSGRFFYGNNASISPYKDEGAWSFRCVVE